MENYDRVRNNSKNVQQIKIYKKVNMTKLSIDPLGIIAI